MTRRKRITTEKYVYDNRKNELFRPNSVDQNPATSDFEQQLHQTCNMNSKMSQKQLPDNEVEKRGSNRVLNDKKVEEQILNEIGSDNDSDDA